MASDPALTQSVSVYVALRPFVASAMLLGLLPVSNVTAARSCDLHFRWRSWRTLLSLLLLSGIVMAFAATAFYFATTGRANRFSMEELVVQPRETVFYFSAATFLALSIRAASHLPTTLSHWDNVVTAMDTALRPLSASQTRLHLGARNATWLLLFFAVGAVAEHELHDITVSLACRPPVSAARCYLSNGNFYFAALLPEGFYHPVLVAAIFVLNQFATLAWNIHDILVALLARALYHNFRSLSRHLRATHRHLTAEQWAVVRRHYVALCDVTTGVGELLSPGVLLSYAINMYFLCIQIFYALRPSNRTALESIYFCVSFYHLFVRLCVVTFTASSFREESQVPLQYLHRCPSKSYCTETRRLLKYIGTVPVGFSGFKLFTISRGFFLAIMSVVFTYELILLNVK